MRKRFGAEGGMTALYGQSWRPPSEVDGLVRMRISFEFDIWVSAETPNSDAEYVIGQLAARLSGQEDSEVYDEIQRKKFGL